MRTKFFFVSDANDLNFFIMYSAKLNFWFFCDRVFDVFGVFGYHFGLVRLAHLFYHFGERYIFGKVLKIDFLHILLMAAVLTFEESGSFIINDFLDAASTSAVLAVRHHAWLAGGVKVLVAETAF